MSSPSPSTRFWQQERGEYVNMKIGIPLGPLSVEVQFVGQINIQKCGGTYGGDLHCGRGIDLVMCVPFIYGTLQFWVQDGDAGRPAAWLWVEWVEFDLHVFDVEFKGKFSVLPIPRWSPSPDKPFEVASSPKAVATIASPSIRSTARLRP